MESGWAHPNIFSVYVGSLIFCVNDTYFLFANIKKKDYRKKEKQKKRHLKLINCYYTQLEVHFTYFNYLVSRVNKLKQY